MNTRISVVAAVLAGMMTVGPVVQSAVAQANPAMVKKLTDALPAAASAKASHKRMVLVISKCYGFKHAVIPLTAKAIELMGAKTGAYVPVFDDDINRLNTKELKKYDAIILNNTTKLALSEDQKKALLAFVNEGKGLVGFHAATDNFDNWPEGIAMMGGLFDGHPWGAGGTWAYKLDDPGHVLNKAFGGVGFKFSDEIYQYKVDRFNTAESLKFLISLDLADPVTGSHIGNKGKDGRYAISWIRNQGKGRVFYCSFGHNESAVCNPAVLKHYLDGIQFAIGDLKADATPSLYADIAAYDFGKSRQELSLVKEAIRKADAGERLVIEQRLLTVLSDAKATLAAKQFVCDCLVLVGTDVSVPALSALLTDKGVSHMARMALQHIQGKAADKALIAAVKHTDGDVRAGVIATLGSRKTVDAVGVLADRLSDKNETVVRAALTALASIGAPSSAKRLMKAGKKMPVALRGAWADACLTVADARLRAGDAKAASLIYGDLYSVEALPVAVRIGALRGLADSKGSGATEVLLAAMKSKDPALKSAAARAIKNAGSAVLVRQVLSTFTDYDGEVQAVVLGSLVEMSGVVRVADIMPLSDSADPAVSSVAYQLMGEIGGAADVPALVAKIVANPDKKEGAIGALAALKGQDTDDAIIKAMLAAVPVVQVDLIKILVTRNCEKSVKVLIPLLGVQDTAVSGEALKAVTLMADAEVINEVAGLVLTNGNPLKMAQAVVLIGRRTDTLQKAATALTAVWAKAGSAQKMAILSVLPAVGNQESLALVRIALADKADAVYDAAVRAVADWKDSAPIDEVFKLSSSAKSDTQKILALRSFIRMAGSEADAGKRLARYAEAMKLAGRDDERKLVITGLGGIMTLEAYKSVSSYLDTPALSSEAQLASLAIAQGIKDANPAAVVDGMKKILAAPVNDWAKDEAGKILKAATAKLPPAGK